MLKIPFVIPSEFYSNTYRFIQDDLQLVAVVHKQTGRQYLVARKIDVTNQTIIIQNYLECIHTAISDISVTEYKNLQENSDSFTEFHSRMLNVLEIERRNLENHDEEDEEYNQEETENQDVRNIGVYPVGINISPEEHFFAFSSWVEGIAEQGMNAILVEREIEEYAHLMYPISMFLLKFLSRVNVDFLWQYIYFIEKECVYDGKPHLPSLRANLLPIMVGLYQPASGEIDIDALFDVTEEQEERRRENNMAFEVTDAMREEILLKLVELDKEFVFSSEKACRYVVSQSPAMANFQEYNRYFFDSDIKVRSYAVENPNATNHDQYYFLFDPKNSILFPLIAANPNATRFKKEFAKLFSIDNSWHNRKEVLESLRDNPKAKEFAEYEDAFGQSFSDYCKSLDSKRKLAYAYFFIELHSEFDWNFYSKPELISLLRDEATTYSIRDEESEKICELFFKNLDILKSQFDPIKNAIDQFIESKSDITGEKILDMRLKIPDSQVEKFIKLIHDNDDLSLYIYRKTSKFKF